MQKCVPHVASTIWREAALIEGDGHRAVYSGPGQGWTQILAPSDQPCDLGTQFYLLSCSSLSYRLGMVTGPPLHSGGNRS